jgi:hypothetical protein
MPIVSGVLQVWKFWNICFVGGPFSFKTHLTEYCNFEIAKSYKGLIENFFNFLGSPGTNAGVTGYETL